MENEREPIMEFFEIEYTGHDEHDDLMKHFLKAANEIHRLKRSAERSVALRKLLESKDSATRALR